VVRNIFSAASNLISFYVPVDVGLFSILVKYLVIVVHFGCVRLLGPAALAVFSHSTVPYITAVGQLTQSVPFHNYSAKLLLLLNWK